jgi:ribosomal protein L11 methylase PrmA
MSAEVDHASFRDPSGHVFMLDGRVLRTVMPVAAADFDFVRGSGLVDELVRAGQLVAETQVSPTDLGPLGAGAHRVLEHPRLQFISHPYEWTFAGLKAAALLHLDVQLRALARDVTLSDASAYNVQFVGPRPIFIDHLSFRRYRVGEYWLAHQQFCQQFLAPLLLRAKTGVAHNAWYRGSPEGISVVELDSLLPLRSKFSWNVFTHITMQARLQRVSTRSNANKVGPSRPLPKSALIAMLSGLRRWVDGLYALDTGATVWSEYATHNSYSDEEAAAKRDFVFEFASQVRPAMLWDLGCNTGDYSKVALTAGAGLAVGFDADHGALEFAFARAQAEQLNFLPLFLDATNPAPSQGWAERERRGFSSRASATGLLALALIHHLAIAKNIPLAQVIDWLIGLAPQGVIEFVPKTDPMVVRLLQLREDIFPNYTESEFLRYIESRARIIMSKTVSKSGRLLIWYSRQ